MLSVPEESKMLTGKQQQQQQESTKKEKAITYSWFGRINIVKMSILPRVICRFNSTSVKILIAFFTEIGKCL